MHADATSSDQRLRSRRRVSLFVPGFALGFLLLAALTCAGTLYFAGLDSRGLAELRGRAEAAWTPPPTLDIPPTTEALVSTNTEQAGDYTFRSGSHVRNITSTRVNIRMTPGYLGKPASDVVAQALPGEIAEILDGPQSADGLVWWYVRLSEDGVQGEGWMAEATASGVQILGQVEGGE